MPARSRIQVSSNTGLPTEAAKAGPVRRSGVAAKAETKTGTRASKCTEARVSITAQFEFEAFKSLPCGCVAAVHRTLDPGLSVVSLEAKGTYCGLMAHVLGRSAAVPAAVANQIECAELEED